MTLNKIWKYVQANQLVVVGGGLLVLVILGGIVWSNGNGRVETLEVTRGDFVQQVSVSGKVMADQEVNLGFSQSGRIQGIYAKEGQVVTRGTLLAEVENGDLYAALVQKRAALDREKAELDALKRGTRPEEISVSESSVASARASLKAAEQATVDAILSAYSVSDGAVHATVDQFFSNPNSTSPQLTFLVSSSALESLVETERVTAGKVLSEWQAKSATAEEAQQYLMKISIFLADVSAALAAAIPSSGVSQTTLDTYRSNVATARASINTSVSTLTTALKSLTAAETALVTAERDLALLKAGATEEDIRAQEATVEAAEADVLSATAQLQKTQIVASFKGTVTKIDARVGESVSPSEAKVSLIGSGAFEIESFVPELSVFLVKPGDPAHITFDSYGENVVFPAEVVTVDLGPTTRDGVTTYRTILVFTQVDERIRSGMTANVVITTTTKSDVISIPQTLVSYQSGVSSVNVLVGETIVVREVKTGGVSREGNIEVLEGLSVGERVVIK